MSTATKSVRIDINYMDTRVRKRKILPVRATLLKAPVGQATKLFVCPFTRWGFSLFQIALILLKNVTDYK